MPLHISRANFAFAALAHRLFASFAHPTRKMLASLAKSDAAPYCYLSTQHAAAQRCVELVCARPNHEDDSNKSTILDVVFPFQSELLHGQRVFAEGELKQELDLCGIEFNDEHAACDFVTEILRKGKFTAKLQDFDAFTLQLKALDGTLVELHKFDRIRQPEAIAHIKLIATSAQQKSKSNKRLSSTTYSSQSSSQAALTTSHADDDDDNKPRGVETVVIADKPKKKKLRA